ncbi:hypothetical protein W02_09570 [Nitrospira sp. KM1]|uniref:sensor histidine kinase n=1 Tax=Nitrospira sp. KM1 TaxID=1936990 RepID=UPI0013A76CF3|nr:sensor histidine kinase [Nitrospira sp. KM1]BCA53817.1 hypothetical protein W02_09570 [Nitrospira sp. KM1]
MLYVIVTVACAGAVFTGTALHAGWPDWRWYHEPLHSAIEALGGLSAIAMAVVLLYRQGECAEDKYWALASGFLGMGVLEEFHAISRPGDGFVFFRNLASLTGGVGFLLVWRADLTSGTNGRKLPLIIALGAFFAGLWFLSFPRHIPVMVRNGEFTPTAVAPQSLACIFFMAGAVRFLFDYHRIGRAEDALFASVGCLFALAELEFMYSMPWDSRWWFWHTLRLTAFLLALGYIGRIYFQVTSDLRASFAQVVTAKDTLTRSEDRLRLALNDRTRISQDLHDSTIQSLFAIGLNLERCQRLISMTHHEVAMQLEAAVTSLKTVIRDLRGHILGLETPVPTRRTFEVTLASLVEDLTISGRLNLTVEVDADAAHLVTDQQSTHLLPIIREAVTNSLRHAAAHGSTLSLQVHNGHVRLTVQDDGVGFDTATMRRGGHGLNNIARRAGALGGRLEIVSNPGRGTRIVLDLPSVPAHATI